MGATQAPSSLELSMKTAIAVLWLSRKANATNSESFYHAGFGQCLFTTHSNARYFRTLPRTIFSYTLQAFYSLFKVFASTST
ncbi:hypothetical protein A0256_13980 [Mucilaginibacter sp. PAMC 26640]|nr:hypothetical protein A0256_13980 [Mucilaginibacter sp. PAMC 26640]